MSETLTAAPETPPPVVVPNLTEKRRRDQVVVAVVLVFTLLLVLAAGATTPGFLTLDNMSTVVRNASVTGIAAIGLALITISGGLISLAVAETASVAAIIYVIVVNSTGSPVVAIGTVLLACAVVGGLQGLAVHGGANPILLTLGVGAAFIGTASLISGNKSVSLTQSAGTFIGRVQIFGMPSQSFLFIVLAVLVTLFILRTRLGREIVLTGGSRRAATAAGVRVRTSLVLSFGLCSVLVGFAAILQTSQFGTTTPFQFSPLTFDALTSVLVGGIAIQGGRGYPAGAALGACFVTLVANILVLRSYNYGVQLTVQGILVVAAVIGFSFVRARRIQ